MVIAIIAGAGLLLATPASAQAPDWSVDASSFEHSHNATAAVLQGQARLSGSDHRLAAFVGDELRGVAGPTEVSGQWLFFLTIHGETSGERVTFRAYDATAGRVVNITQTLDFSVNGITGSPSNPLWLEASQSTSNEPGTPAAQALRLGQNAPNPFTNTTRIAFELPYETHVSLELFDLLGRRVAVLVDEHRAAGSHAVGFHANDLPSGHYLYRITTDRASRTRLMIVR